MTFENKRKDVSKMKLTRIFVLLFAPVLLGSCATSKAASERKDTKVSYEYITFFNGSVQLNVYNPDSLCSELIYYYAPKLDGSTREEITCTSRKTRKTWGFVFSAKSGATYIVKAYRVDYKTGERIYFEEAELSSLDFVDIAVNYINIARDHFEKAKTSVKPNSTLYNLIRVK